MTKKRQKDYKIKNGKIYARITYIDENGDRKDKLRLAENKAHAKELAAEMREELKDLGPRIVEAVKMRFEELAGAYEARKLKPAEYQEGRKVAGLRSVDSAKTFLKTLISYFGQMFIKEILPSQIEEFKEKRLNTIAKRSGKKLTIASVNRELELLRAIFNYAKRERYIKRSPFEDLSGIISKVDERQRDRILTNDEETRLLDSCVGPRAHLRPILICAFDTAMRRGEILKLCWRDVDLELKTITVIAMNSKTGKERTVGMTLRLWVELARLWEESPKDPNILVFGIQNNFKRSFAKVCEIAGVKDFRFHDSRHTATTRIVETGELHTQEAMKITGHSEMKTFARYVNPKNEAARRAAEALDKRQGVVVSEHVKDDESDTQTSELIN